MSNFKEYKDSEGYTVKYYTSPGVRTVGMTSPDTSGVMKFLADRVGVNAAADYVTGNLVDKASRLPMFAGQLCYQSFGERRSKDGPEYIKKILEQAHGSVLEHFSISLVIWGVSRATTHELVRHRAGFAYSQLSQRYVTNELRFVLRPELANDVNLRLDALKGFVEVQKRYMSMLERLATGGGDTKSKKECAQVARDILPNCTETNLVVTANVRAWRNFLEQRGSKFADTAIRQLAVEVCVELQYQAHDMFADFDIADDGTITNTYRKV